MGSFERPSAGIGEPMDVYLHGYVSSRIMNMARDGEKNGGSEEGGMRICVCATKVGGPLIPHATLPMDLPLGVSYCNSLLNHPIDAG